MLKDGKPDDTLIAGPFQGDQQPASLGTCTAQLVVLDQLRQQSLDATGDKLYGVRVVVVWV